MSLATILHEIGHAQERMLSADAQSEYVEAQVARNRDAVAANTQETALRTATTTALAGWAKQKVARTAAAKAFVATFRAVTPAIDAMRQAVDATSAAPLRQAAQVAVAARDKAKDAVRASNPVLALFAPAVTAQDAYLAATEAFLTSMQAVDTTKTPMRTPRWTPPGRSAPACNDSSTSSTPSTFHDHPVRQEQLARQSRGVLRRGVLPLAHGSQVPGLRVTGPQEVVRRWRTPRVRARFRMSSVCYRGRTLR